MYEIVFNFVKTYYNLVIIIIILINKYLGGVQMISFILAIIALIAGYFIYGTIVEKVFGADEKIQTPAVRLADGVDFVEMPEWKIFLNSIS